MQPSLSKLSPNESLNLTAIDSPQDDEPPHQPTSTQQPTQPTSTPHQPLTSTQPTSRPYVFQQPEGYPTEVNRSSPEGLRPSPLLNTMMTAAPVSNAFNGGLFGSSNFMTSSSNSWFPSNHLDIEDFQRRTQAFVRQVTDALPSFTSSSPPDSPPGAESPAAVLPQSARAHFFPSPPVQHPLGFSFSPAGLLLPYHLGVIKYLSDINVIHESVPVGGASAGSIAVACLCINIGMDEAMRAVFRLESDLRRKGTTYRLKRLLERELELILPQDAHVRANDRKSAAYVVYTSVGWTMRKELVNQFASRKDFIDCILASCNIPFYFHKRPTVKCRGNMAIDGYFSDPKNFGCPNIPDTNRLVRVLPFSAKQLLSHLPTHDLISPDLSELDDKLTAQEIEEFQQYLQNCPAPQTPESRRHTVADGSPKPVTIGPPSKLPAMPVGPSTPPTPRQQEGGVSTISTNANFSAALSDEGEPNKASDFSRTQSKTNPTIPTKEPPVRTDRSRSEVWQHTRSSHSQPVCMRRRFFLRHSSRQSESRRGSATSALPRNGEGRSWWSRHGRRESWLGNSWLSALSRSSDMRQQPQQPSSSHILPDIPRTQFTWHTLLHYALKPTDDDDVLRELYDLGRADAFRWACLERRRNRKPEG